MARIPVLTQAELRAVEAAHADSVPPLMERAGSAVAHVAVHLAAEGPILVIAGPGNNGGDAWVAARRLAAMTREVIVYDATGTEPKAAEARAARAALHGTGTRVVTEWPDALAPALIVDGLLGIGLARDVAGPLASIIQRINQAGLPVLAIDLP